MSNAESDLKQIKIMMERSSRFISLSGLSGVFVGIYALIGAFIAYHYFMPKTKLARASALESNNYNLESLIAIAGGILLLSLVTAIYFTTRNARKNHQKIWDRTSRLLLLNLCIPLAAGGFFVLILLYHGTVYLVAPAMLIFYGLGLINGSKYTLNDIRYLGFSEIILGLLATLYYGHGLLFWILGFGVLHIVYGAVMYFKYER